MPRKLFTKIKLEILGADLIIEDADISLEIEKKSEEKYNSCKIIIYNLSDNTYNLINDKTNAVRVYVDIDGEGYTLVFQGDLRQLEKHKKATSTKRKSKAKITHYNEPSIFREYSGADIETVISLEDGIKNYVLDNYVSKSYSGRISNKTILNDIFQQAKKNGLQISANIDDIEEKIYPNGKILQCSLKSALQTLCSDGKCDCKINNNIVVIQKKSITGTSFGYILTADNCPKPEFQSDKKIKILAPFLPIINPLDFVRLKFQDLDDVYKVKSVSSRVDNFGKNYETEIIVTY